VALTKRKKTYATDPFLNFEPQNKKRKNTRDKPLLLFLLPFSSTDPCGQNDMKTMDVFTENVSFDDAADEVIQLALS